MPAPAGITSRRLDPQPAGARPLAPLQRYASGPVFFLRVPRDDRRPSGEQPAVHRRRRQPLHLRLQAGHRVVVHDDAITGFEVTSQLKRRAAASGLLLEVPRRVALSIDLDLGDFHWLAEHVLPPDSVQRVAPQPATSIGRASCARKVEHERGALADLARDRDPAAELLDNLPRDGQAEAEAAALGGDEIFEDGGQPVGRNAASRVDDPHRDAVAVRLGRDR